MAELAIEILVPYWKIFLLEWRKAHEAFLVVCIKKVRSFILLLFIQHHSCGWWCTKNRSAARGAYNLLFNKGKQLVIRLRSHCQRPLGRDGSVVQFDTRKYASIVNIWEEPFQFGCLGETQCETSYNHARMHARTFVPKFKNSKGVLCICKPGNSRADALMRVQSAIIPTSLTEKMFTLHIKIKTDYWHLIKRIMEHGWLVVQSLPCRESQVHPWHFHGNRIKHFHGSRTGRDLILTSLVSFCKPTRFK